MKYVHTVVVVEGACYQDFKQFDVAALEGGRSHGTGKRSCVSYDCTCTGE